MKPITFFFAVLLVVAGFGAGILVGRHGAKANSTPTEVLPDPNASAPDANKVPAGELMSRPAHAAAANPGVRLSLVEVETALADLNKLSRTTFLKRVGEIAKATAPADFPQLMALASRLPVEMQYSLRSELCPRWAETDPRAAMKYAGGIKNFNDRQQAILLVLSGWALSDAAGATAWIQQLPPGALRNEAPGTIARALAEKDPAAAFALLKDSKADRNFNYGYGAYAELFDAWAARDPATAAALAVEDREPGTTTASLSYHRGTLGGEEPTRGS